MIKFRKIIASITAVILVIALTSGCGNKAANGGQKDSSAKAGETKNPADEKSGLAPYELTWYVLGNGQQKDTPLVEAEVNKYLKDKINATLKLTCFDWGTYDQKLNAMIAAGEPFDIFFTCSWAADVRMNALKGGLQPLDELMDKYAPQTKAMLGKEFLTAASINGKLYAVPANKEKAQGTGIVFRKDLIDKYKIDLSKIKSLEDCEPYFEIIKKNEPEIYVMEAIAGADGPTRLNADIDSPAAGCAVADDGKTIIAGVDHPRYEPMIKLVNKYYKAGYIRKDAASITDSTPDQKAGKLFAMFPQLKPGKDVEMSASLGYEVKQVQFGKPVITNGDISGSMQGISRTSKNPERAMMFIELFNTDKYLNNLINFGIEGKHYVKVSDNVIDFAPGTDGGKNSGYNPASAWMFGNVFLTYLFKNDDSDKWEQYRKWNDEAIYAPSVGFVFNPDKVKTEVAAIGNVYSEFKGLSSGALDPEEYIPKYKAKLKAAGLDKIIAECQKQFNEFLAAKK